jgi:hypothetical protein
VKVLIDAASPVLLLLPPVLWCSLPWRWSKPETMWPAIVAGMQIIGLDVFPVPVRPVRLCNRIRLVHQQALQLD